MDLSVCRPFICVCVCVFCRIQTHSCTGHWADWSREREHTLGTLFVARTKCTEHMSQKALFHCRSTLRYTNTGSLRGTSGGKHSRTWKTPGQTRLYFHEECERQLWTECDALRGRERERHCSAEMLHFKARSTCIPTSHVWVWVFTWFGDC